jgi:catechol 2,3-dioxygenase-like lactoylglutathione lyase family enzyme
MSFKVRVLVLLGVLGVLFVSGCNSGSAGPIQGIRFEHIALNVDNSVETARWYRDNMGMVILRGGDDPTSKQFVSDPGGNMMFEFYHTELAKVPDYASMHNHEIHIAFHVDDVKAACQRLIDAGARMDGEIVVTPDGDEIAIVRDPWGIPIQFVRRAEQML